MYEYDAEGSSMCVASSLTFRFTDDKIAAQTFEDTDHCAINESLDAVALKALTLVCSLSFYIK